jgi:putative acyl-CoA dehydrogenase
VQLVADLDAARGADSRYDAALDAHLNRWPGLPEEAEARWFAECLSLLLTASVLIRQAPAPVADAFVATRLEGARGHIPGAIAPADTQSLLERLGPAFR